MKSLSSGFSTKEFLMVLIVLGILCFAAIPQFNYLQSAKRQSDFDQSFTALRSRLEDEKKQPKSEEQLPFPLTLDTQTDDSKCTQCFESMQINVANQDLWYKKSSNEYFYSKNGNNELSSDFMESGDIKLTYDSTQGTVNAVVLP